MSFSALLQNRNTMTVAVKPTTIALGAVAIGLIVKLLLIGRRPKNYPPGPPTLPLLGNIHQVRITSKTSHSMVERH